MYALEISMASSDEWDFSLYYFAMKHMNIYTK